MARKKYPVITRRKSEFYAARRDSPKVEIEGHAVEITPWMDGFVYMCTDRWSCNEIQTGYGLAYASTMKEAAMKARKLVLRHGHKLALAQVASVLEAQKSEKGGD